MSYLLQVVHEVQNSFLEKYSGLFSAILIICLFIIERLINGNENRKQNRINWYSNVLIQPNLITINKFFFDFTEETKRIITIRNTLLDFSPTQRTLINAKEYYNLQNLCRNFEFDFLILISQYDVELYSTLLYDLVNPLYDFVVSNLGEEDVQLNRLNHLLDQIKTTKSLFFSNLYQRI